MWKPFARRRSACSCSASCSSCQPIERDHESTMPLPTSTQRTYEPLPSARRTHAAASSIDSASSRMPWTSTTGSGRDFRSSREPAPHAAAASSSWPEPIRMPLPVPSPVPSLAPLSSSFDGRRARPPRSEKPPARMPAPVDEEFLASPAAQVGAMRVVASGWALRWSCGGGRRAASKGYCTQLMIVRILLALGRTCGLRGRSLRATA